MVILAGIGPTRTEVDFLRHIAKTIATNPDMDWVFIADNLNTHVCEASAPRGEVSNSTSPRAEREMRHLEKQGLAEGPSSRTSRIIFASCTRHPTRRGSTKRKSGFPSSCAVAEAGVIQVPRGIGSTPPRVRRILLPSPAKPFKWTYAGRPLVAAIGGAAACRRVAGSSGRPPTPTGGGDRRGSGLTIFDITFGIPAKTYFQIPRSPHWIKAWEQCQKSWTQSRKN